TRRARFRCRAIASVLGNYFTAHVTRYRGRLFDGAFARDGHVLYLRLTWGCKKPVARQRHQNAVSAHARLAFWFGIKHFVNCIVGLYVVALLPCGEIRQPSGRSQCGRFLESSIRPPGFILAWFYF